MRDNISEFDPRKYLQVATDAMKEIVIARYEAFVAHSAAEGGLAPPIDVDLVWHTHMLRGADYAAESAAMCGGKHGACLQSMCGAPRLSDGKAQGAPPRAAARRLASARPLGLGPDAKRALYTYNASEIAALLQYAIERGVVVVAELRSQVASRQGIGARVASSALEQLPHCLQRARSFQGGHHDLLVPTILSGVRRNPQRLVGR